MLDKAKIVHVAWGVSIAATVRDALREQGCKARVIGLPGSLDFGPINPPEPNTRKAWIRTVLRCAPDDDRRESEEAWTEAISVQVHPVYWVCMTNAGEQASFLEFAYRMNGRPFDVIDATGFDFVTRGGIRTPLSLGIMRCEDLVASGLKDRRRRFSRAECEAASARWAQLRNEDAPLRVIREGRLVSAPLTHFDFIILSQAATDWEVAAKLIGRTLHHLLHDTVSPGQVVSDILLLGRVLALADEGRLYIRGAGRGLRDYEVRRPAGSRAS